MDFLKRMFTLPKSANSFSDIAKNPIGAATNVLRWSAPLMMGIPGGPSAFLGTLFRDPSGIGKLIGSWSTGNIAEFAKKNPWQALGFLAAGAGGTGSAPTRQAPSSLGQLIPGMLGSSGESHTAKGEREVRRQQRRIRDMLLNRLSGLSAVSWSQPQSTAFFAAGLPQVLETIARGEGDASGVLAQWAMQSAQLRNQRDMGVLDLQSRLLLSMMEYDRAMRLAQMDINNPQRTLATVLALGNIDKQ